MRRFPHSEESERWAALACLPIAATGFFYTLPDPMQSRPVLQFFPQLLAYLCLLAWSSRSSAWLRQLGLSRTGWKPGILWGGITGVVLGIVNTAVILWVVPWLGNDIGFLRQTPHAQVPTLLMMPWGILLIAILVELNFRGFLLGRLLALFQAGPLSQLRWGPPSLAVIISAVAFAFDPFMVMTFKHLHWIALWDGTLWGLLLVRLRTLSAPIAAHAVEVMIMYSTLKWTLH